ncbi:MAG: BatA domain-containing protein [Planctomycetota bacterium]
MNALAFISLTSPIMLLGAALVALPIAAHLLNRKARQRVVFPSVALLSSVSASQSSFFKLRRWLLLLLRCAAVVLVVLAFVRPVWLNPASSTAATGTTSGDTAAVVVVLDVSASTRQILGDGQTAADRLRAQAVRELGQLRPGTDYANVVFADANPAAVFDVLTRNVAALRLAVEAATPSDHRADLAGAMSLASQLLADHDQPDAARHLLVLTDGQRTNWDELGDAQLPRDVQLIVQTVGNDNTAAANTALGSPESRPGRPGVGVPTELSVEVAHFSDTPTRVRIDLLIDDQEVDSQWVRLTANQRKRVSFTRRFESAGQHRIKYRIESDDALALDNTAAQVVDCVRRRPVIVVGDANPDQPGTAGYYVTRALAPHNGDRDRFLVTHLASTSVRGDALAGTSLVIVGDVDRLDRVAEATLTRYVEDGGACLLLAGNRPARSDALLPWQLIAQGSGGKAVDGEWEAAELTGFSVEAQDTLARTALGRVWRVSNLLPEARVLLRNDRGEPVLAGRPVGDGRVVAAAFSPSGDTGDLGKYGVFVVLMQSLAERLTTRADTRRPDFPGRPIQIAAADAVDPRGPAHRIETPDGQTAAGVVFGLDSGTASAVATVPVSDRAGFYTWRQGPATLGQAAVNIDPRESDLRELPSEALASTLEQKGVATASVNGIGDGGEALRFGGAGLWGWMLMGALGLLCVEMGLLGGWRR